VRTFIQAGYDRAFEIITEKNVEFERLAQGLLEYETLTGDEIKRVMAGEPPHAGSDADDTPPSGGTPSVTAIPKTKPKKPRASDDGGMEPEPSA
jgi:cell division protease FtsH